MSASAFSDRASGGRRAASLALDLFGLVVLSVIIGVVASSLFSVSEQEFVEQKGFSSPLAVGLDSFGLALSGVLIVPLVYLLMETVGAATPGKRFLKLRLGAADGTPAPFRRLLLRALFKYGLLIATVLFGWYFLLLGIEYPLARSLWNGVVVVWLLALLVGWFLVFGKNRQALHDKLSKTAVYRIDAA